MGVVPLSTGVRDAVLTDNNNHEQIVPFSSLSTRRAAGTVPSERRLETVVVGMLGRATRMG